MLARVADPAIQDRELTTFESTVRALRLQLIEQAGGIERLPLTRLWQIDSLVARHIVKGRLEQDVLHLAEHGGLVNLRSRREHPVSAAWLRHADGYERALEAAGLERVAGASEQERLLADLDRRLARSPQVEREPEMGGHAAAGGVESAPGVSEPGQAGPDPEPEAGRVTDAVAEPAGRAASLILGAWSVVPERQAEPEIAF